MEEQDGVFCCRKGVVVDLYLLILILGEIGWFRLVGYLLGTVSGGVVSLPPLEEKPQFMWFVAGKWLAFMLVSGGGDDFFGGAKA